MKSGESYNKRIGRREFFRLASFIVMAGAVAVSCKSKVKGILLRLSGTNHVLGHRLWAKNFAAPSKTIAAKYVIVGGGISGLSAARQLAKLGITDFLLLEMERSTGGNSSAGENKFTKYPLGAHYLPLPNLDDKALLDFLLESRIITKFNGSIPEFDGNQLCFAPHERLYIRNSWQEGLVPKFGNNMSADSEVARFFKEMSLLREQKGEDGKYHFTIPLSAGSADTKYRFLDEMTMEDWMSENKYTSDELRWYIDYCCRDDFGLGIAHVSAWAGLHYFTARRNTYGPDAVLTWPEGNSRLANHLKKFSSDRTLCCHLAYHVALKDDCVEVFAYDDVNKKSLRIEAEKVIMATPQYVNSRLLMGRGEDTRKLAYAPWLLATITLSGLPDNESFPLSWDNVIYKGKGLGYIYDQHQSVAQHNEKKVITYYYSYSQKMPTDARKHLYRQSAEYLREFVLADLETAHPCLSNYVEDMSIHRLGHGMVTPTRGSIFGDARQRLRRPVGNRIFFAHSDLSGLSLFEEAFHQGINAVNAMINETALDT